MSWINTLATAAKMVIYQFLRYLANKVSIRPAVSANAPVVEMKDTIPMTVTPSAPQPTATRDGVDLRKEPSEDFVHVIDSIAQSVLAVAKTQLGVEEHPRGSNSGPDVDKYLAFVHTRPGEPWCSAAVSWCCHAGGATQMRYSASAMRLLELNAPLRLLGPQPGCVGIVDHGQGKGHAFFVVAVTPGGLVTYEPNSNPDGGREGYIFCKRLRAQGTVTGGYLRIA